MFRYYNYTLIESNRSYSTKKIQTLLGINPQTIRAWIKYDNLLCVSQKPILIYGAIIKSFIKERNEKHKKTIQFNEMKCLKCKGVSTPKDNQVSLYNNKNGSIRAVGICPNCNYEFNKLYKRNSLDELKNTFFINPAVITLYNTLPISSNTHIDNLQKILLSDVLFPLERNQYKPNKTSSTKTPLKQEKTNYKTHIKEEITLFGYEE